MAARRVSKKKASINKAGATHAGHRRVPNCPKHAIGNSVRSCDNDIWKRIKKNYHRLNIFLNVTYLTEYRARLHLLLSFLLRFGFNPVLASAEKREGTIRLCKLCELIQGCMYCITDLSYESRHNAPFEAGMIYGLGRRNIFVFGGRHKVKGSHQKILDFRISNIRSVDEVVYYQATKPDDLASRLIERFCSSPELQRLSPVEIRSSFAAGYVSWKHTTIREILAGQKIVSDLTRQHRGDYSSVITHLRNARANFGRARNP